MLFDEIPLQITSALGGIQWEDDEGLGVDISTVVDGLALDMFLHMSNALLSPAISRTDFPVPIYCG